MKNNIKNIYVIKHLTKGYLCEDVDHILTYYSDEINECTIKFESEEEAELNCEEGDSVIKLKVN